MKLRAIRCCTAVLCTVIALQFQLADSAKTVVDCFEDFLLKANIHADSVARYIRIFRGDGISPSDLDDFSFLGLVKLLHRNSVTSTTDAIHLYNAIRHRHVYLSLSPFCHNGGKCAFDRHQSQHICRCQRNFDGKRCQDATGAQTNSVNIAVTYTHWGSKSCGGGKDSNTETIYHGHVAANRISENNGGAGWVCLPGDPIYVQGAHRPGANGGLLSAVELETDSFPPYHSITDHDPACSVCRVSRRATQLMIPARNVCPEGWTRQYHGFLMSTGAHHEFSSELICMDRRPDVIAGSHQDRDGAELHPVEAMCSKDLPCPPYAATKELTCAVCTK